MNNDNLITCPHCGGNACYENKITEEITTKHCFGCGFCTNSLMKDGEEFFEQQKTVLPELYKDLQWTDPETGLIWLPSTINEVEKGMIFANGANIDNWGWGAVLAVDVKEEEKEKYPIPGKKGEYYKKRMDMSTIKTFHEREFIDALSYIGLTGE